MRVADAGAVSGARRILMLRSCRPELFAQSVHLVRNRYPGAELSVLTHGGHRRELLAAGVDRVIEVQGQRFDVFRIAPWRLLRIRWRAFDLVVVPQMTAKRIAYLNLYRLAAVSGAKAVLLIGAAAEPLEMCRRAFRRFILEVVSAELHRRLVACRTAILLRWDNELFLALAVAALLVPRRRRSGTAGAARVLHVISHLGMGGAQAQFAALLNRTPPAYRIDVLALGARDGQFARQWIARDDIAIRYIEGWPNLIRSVREIASTCRAGGYDIVHTWLFSANLVGVVAARLARIPGIVTSVRSLSGKDAPNRGRFARCADMLVARGADITTVNAGALVGDYARWARIRPSRVAVVHNGIDGSAPQIDREDARARLAAESGAARTAVLLGAVGRLSVEKDHATFLGIIAAARSVRPDIHAIVIGDGRERLALERRVRELGLTGAVTFLGERDDARALMAGLDLHVLPSTSEGFANVLLEAAIGGVPSIAPDVGGKGEVLGTSELLFPAGDVAAGAARVLEALAEPQRAAERAAAVRQRALTLFTAEQSADSWLRLYRLLLR
jgi:glycosyltransferase involved in cell wall biosynthesis